MRARLLPPLLALLAGCVETAAVVTESAGLPPDRSPYYEFVLRDEESADWADWQRPDTVLDMLDLRPGMRVVEFGAGTGRLSVRIADAVGPEGALVAVENDSRLRAPLEKAIAGRANARAALVDAELRGLGAVGADLALVRNFAYRAGRRDLLYGAVREALAERGRLVVVDFRDARTKPGPPMTERIPMRQALLAWSREGFRPLRERPGLRCQYALEFAWDGFTRVGPLPQPPPNR